MCDVIAFYLKLHTMYYLPWVCDPKAVNGNGPKPVGTGVTGPCSYSLRYTGLVRLGPRSLYLSLGWVHISNPQVPVPEYQPLDAWIQSREGSKGPCTPSSRPRWCHTLNQAVVTSNCKLWVTKSQDNPSVSYELQLVLPLSEDVGSNK